VVVAKIYSALLTCRSSGAKAIGVCECGSVLYCSDGSSSAFVVVVRARDFPDASTTSEPARAAAGCISVDWSEHPPAVTCLESTCCAAVTSSLLRMYQEC
jgi:hypothetical protein